MAWDKFDKLVGRTDGIMDFLLVVLGFSHLVRRGSTQQAGGTPQTPTRTRPPVAPKIPEILAGMENEPRKEVSGWLARYSSEAIDKLELLKTETLQKIFEASGEEREQMVKSLRLPLAGPQTVPQKARFVWAETKKKLQRIEEKLPKTAAAIHEAAEKRRLKEEAREVAGQNPKSDIQRIREWRAARRNKKTGGN